MISIAKVWRNGGVLASMLFDHSLLGTVGLMVPFFLFCLFKILGAINYVYRAPRNVKVKFTTYSRAKTAFSALAHVSKLLFCQESPQKFLEKVAFSSKVPSSTSRFKAQNVHHTNNLAKKGKCSHFLRFLW